jgi:hypothetical protein
LREGGREERRKEEGEKEVERKDGGKKGWREWMHQGRNIVYPYLYFYRCSLFLFHFSNPLFSLLITMDLIALENRMVPVKREKFGEKIGEKKTEEFDRIRTGMN